MIIQDFRAIPLSDSIVHALISATQAYAELDVLMTEHPETKLLLYDMMLVLDVYYQHYDAQPDIEDVCQALYIPEKKSILSKSMAVFENCLLYAKSKISETEVLTAGDIIKIDDAIRFTDAEFLTPDIVPADCEQLIERIWSILYDLYSPQRQYPLPLEAAIACYRFLALPETKHLTLQTLTILFSTVYENELAFSGFARQWMLSTDPRVHIFSIDASDALAHILEVFRCMWTYTATLIRITKQKKTEVSLCVSMALPQYMPSGCGQFLSESLCTRTHDISDRFNLSQKTATKYLRQLEQKDIVHSVKNWRDVYYFNNLLIDLLKDQLLGYPAYGA